MATDDDRRDHARIAFDAPARWASLDGACDLRVLDLSFKGALVEVPASWHAEVGEPCLLGVRLEAPGAAPARIAMSCEVAHRRGNRVGLRCLAMGLDSVTHLRALIAANLGDPALLERELSALAGP